MNNMEIRFSASLSNEAFARTSLIAFVSILNPSIDEISELKTIVSEAISNSIIHGYHLDASKDVTIKASLEENAVTIEVIDYGVGIEDIEMALKPKFTTRPDLERAGMGLTIIQALSNEFSIRSVVDMGTRVTIRKVFTTAKNITYGITNS